MKLIEGENSIYYVDESGKILAEVTFPDITYGVVNINHTFVDESLRGQGIAGKLMEAVVKKLEEDNKKAYLTCSYAVKWFEANPQYKKYVVTL